MEKNPIISVSIPTDKVSEVQLQNTVLVEALFLDKKFLKVFEAVTNKKIINKKVSRYIFLLILVFFIFNYYLLHSPLFSISNIPILDFIFFNVIYFVGLHNYVKRKFWEKRVRDFKNFFVTKDNLLSFLDSMINNKYIRGSINKNVNDTMSTISLTDIEFIALSKKMKQREVKYWNIRSIGDREMQFINFKLLFTRFFLEEDIDVLHDLLKNAGNEIKKEIKMNGITVNSIDKNDLFDLVKNRIIE